MLNGVTATLQTEIKKIHQQVRTTTVYVTHGQGEALALSHEIAVMSEGRIVQIGAPRLLYERPASRFVADFIGIANIFEHDGDWYALRPEKIRLSTTGQGREGKIVDIAYEGDRSLYRVDVGGNVMVAAAPPSDSLRRGSRVWLDWPADAAHRLEN